MEHYKVLLVDDEEEIRYGISSRIAWEELGLTLVGEAENGAEALELAEQLRPDIVLTDIKMPFMDGLTLCRHLRTELPTAKIVVFSGFDDFEYARKAIGMNVSQYILKPINAVELCEVLREITRELDCRHAERRDMEMMRERYAESLPVLRELFFTRLLDGHIDAPHIQERAARYELSLPSKLWAVAMVQVELPADRDELLLLAVRSLFEEQFTLTDGTFHLLLYNDMLAVLVCLPGEDAIYLLMDELDRMCALSQSYRGIPLTIGVSRARADVAQLHLSSDEARSALDYRVLTRARVIYIADLEPGSDKGLTFDENDERALAAAIKLGDADDVRALVDALMPRVREVGTDLTQCQLFFLEFTTCLIRLSRSGGLNHAEVFGKTFTGVIQLTEFASLDAAMTWCCACCLRLQEQLRASRTDSNWRTVEQAKAYIAQHYADPALHVEALCTHLHLSPAYFSTVFKRETDMSFTGYVTGVRMDAAVRLLRETDEKTYWIAEKIGYTDPNYFSYVFKKQFGMSPSKYRTQMNAGKS